MLQKLLITVEIPAPDAIYCMARALVLGILVSAEALLSRHKRVGFERHLLLFSTFCLLMAAEVAGAVISLITDGAPNNPVCGLWIWYPAISAAGLVSLVFCFDFTKGSMLELREESEDIIRRKGRRFFTLVACIFVLAVMLSGVPYDGVCRPTSIMHLGLASMLMHGVQAAAMLALLVKARALAGRWLTRTETKVFVLGCAAGFMGALAQMVNGPREHLTTLAFTVFVAVFLRDNYRRSEIDVVRASEERNARMLLYHRITTQLKSTFDINKLYDTLMDSLLSNLGAESGAIYMLEKREGALRPALLSGPYPPPLPVENGEGKDWLETRERVSLMRVPMGEGPVGRVARTGVPLYICDEDDARRHYPWLTEGLRMSTSIALPLRSPEGVYGVVQVVNRIDRGAFGEEDIRFMSLLVEQAGLAINNARLHAEIVQRQRTEEQIKIAREIQLRLIPTELPRIPGLSIGAEYAAAQEVGGDYFDFFRIDHDHLGIVIFDVSGKGVPGALLMAITGTYLKMAAPRAQSPAWVLNEVNAALSAEIGRGMFVTAIYGVLNLTTLEFVFCSAGHPEMIVVRDRDRSCEKHNPRGAALGLLRPNRFRVVLEQARVRLEPGDTILLYTDGVTEALDARGAQFGETRLCDAAARFAREGPRRLAAEVVAAVRGHAGDAPQYDDITVVACRVGVASETSASDTGAGAPPGATP